MKKYTITADVVVQDELPEDETILMLNEIPVRGIESLPYGVKTRMHLDAVTVGYERTFVSRAQEQEQITAEVAHMRKVAKIDQVVTFLKELNVITDELYITLEKRKCTP